MEVRPIRRDESSQFLRLLCEVFTLDYTRAEGIFYKEPMFDLQRKWALFDGPEMVSILTTVPLTFGWGRSIGIAGVATASQRQNRGYAQCLLETVLSDAHEKGEGSALLFARARGLYQRVGFTELDEVVRGEIPGSVDDTTGPILEFDEVRKMYGAWADQDPARLRRDDQRWNYWKWTLRMCAPIEGGYACLEGNVVREAVSDSRPSSWPVGKGAEWFGLTGMARHLGLEMRSPSADLVLMGYNFPGVPQMFMTDQF